MWIGGQPSPRDKEPSPARRCAQIKHNLKRASCVHPEYALVLTQTVGGGFVEYCSDCMTVTEVYTPETMSKPSTIG